MKRLQEDPPVGFGGYLDEKIMDPLQELVITGGKVMQGRIFNDKCAIPHAVPDLDYGMTRRASQSGLSLRGMKLLFDGNIEFPIEEYCVVMTSRTPFGRLYSHHVLHVLDGLAVPLIIERGEVVHRGIPLLVNVCMTALTGLRGHKEVGRNRLARGRCR
jgi:hypothetical protein